MEQVIHNCTNDSICISQQCRGNRLFCSNCQKELHKDHSDQTSLIQSMRQQYRQALLPYNPLQSVFQELSFFFTDSLKQIDELKESLCDKSGLLPTILALEELEQKPIEEENMQYFASIMESFDNLNPKLREDFQPFKQLSNVKLSGQEEKLAKQCLKDLIAISTKSIQNIQKIFGLPQEGSQQVSFANTIINHDDQSGSLLQKRRFLSRYIIDNNSSYQNNQNKKIKTRSQAQVSEDESSQSSEESSNSSSAKSQNNNRFRRGGKRHNEFTTKQRIDILREALEEKNIKLVAKKHKMSASAIRKWKVRYQNHPEIKKPYLEYRKAFKYPEKYTEERKQQILEEASSSYEARKKVLSQYRIHPSTLRKWEGKYNVQTNESQQMKQEEIDDQNEQQPSQQLQQEQTNKIIIRNNNNNSNINNNSKRITRDFFKRTKNSVNQKFVQQQQQKVQAFSLDEAKQAVKLISMKHKTSSYTEDQLKLIKQNSLVSTVFSGEDSNYESEEEDQDFAQSNGATTLDEGNESGEKIDGMSFLHHINLHPNEFQEICKRIASGQVDKEPQAIVAIDENRMRLFLKKKNEEEFIQIYYFQRPQQIQNMLSLNFNNQNYVILLLDTAVVEMCSWIRKGVITKFQINNPIKSKKIPIIHLESNKEACQVFIPIQNTNQRQISLGLFEIINLQQINSNQQQTNNVSTNNITINSNNNINQDQQPNLIKTIELDLPINLRQHQLTDIQILDDNRIAAAVGNQILFYDSNGKYQFRHKLDRKERIIFIKKSLVADKSIYLLTKQLQVIKLSFESEKIVIKSEIFKLQIKSKNNNLSFKVFQSQEGEMISVGINQNIFLLRGTDLVCFQKLEVEDGNLSSQSLTIFKNKNNQSCLAYSSNRENIFINQINFN